MITLTDEQRAAVSAPGNVFLSACPGSGKTRVITAKLLAVAETVVNTPRSVACITYTNPAVDEIELRLKQFGNQAILERTEISTIHSFCLHNILRPYRWLAPQVPKNFRILTREMPEFEELVAVVENEVGRALGPRTIDDYAGVGVGIDGQPFGDGISTGIVTPALALRLWDLMRARGFIDFSMAIFYSFQILKTYPFVATGVSSRFQWILIDEFQDTTEVQLAIFQVLFTQSHTCFFLVGDENQSIFGFAGARPDAADAFATLIGAKGDHSLSGNFRSSPGIVGLAEALIPRKLAMHSVGRAKTYTDEPLYVHVSDPRQAITDHFLPWLEKRGIPLGNSAVLAPWWTHLVPVARHLRDLGIPVVGPGARPYQRTRLFAPLAEQLGACAEADHYMDIGGVERAIFRLVQESLGATRFDIFSYEGRRTALTLIYEAKRIAQTGVGGLAWLRACAETSSDILILDGWLLETQRGLLRASVDQMTDDMVRRNIDLQNLQIADLGIFANPDKAIKLITLHHSKGREFDATALISMNEGAIPHFNDRTVEEFEEARRLFYVGVSRARKALLIASDESHWRNRPSRYIEQCGIPRSA